MNYTYVIATMHIFTDPVTYVHVRIYTVFFQLHIGNSPNDDDDDDGTNVGVIIGSTVGSIVGIAVIIIIAIVVVHVVKLVSWYTFNQVICMCITLLALSIIYP